MDCYKHFSTIFWKFKWRIGYRKYSSLSKINRQWRKWRALAKSLILCLSCNVKKSKTMCRINLFIKGYFMCFINKFWPKKSNLANHKYTFFPHFIISPNNSSIIWGHKVVINSSCLLKHLTKHPLTRFFFNQKNIATNKREFNLLAN